MAEKRGFTGKLEFPFNQVGVLEIQKGGRWFRVTDRYFRSYDGPRRITAPTEVARGMHNRDVNRETVMYEGPIYEYMTNNVVPYKNTETFIYLHENAPEVEIDLKLRKSI